MSPLFYISTDMPLHISIDITDLQNAHFSQFLLPELAI
jgi:hypothetical protein